jgi:uncharacterized protein (TIGR03437 family)
MEVVNMRLTLMSVLLVSVGTLGAQTVACTAAADDPPVRGEGLTELVGDIVLQCTRASTGATAAPYFNTDVQLFLNTSFTNRIIPNQGNALADPVLVIDENYGNPTASSTLGGPQPGVPLPQFGAILGGNGLLWQQVQFPIPGALLPNGQRLPDPTILRITNLRVNASNLSSGSGLAAPIIISSLTVKDGAVLLGANVVTSVGHVQSGLQTGVRNTISALPQCQSYNPSLNGNPAFYVSLTEAFSNAFLPLGSPSTTPDSPRSVEAGYPTGMAGATQGTQFRLAFHNLPFGIRLGVPGDLSNGTLRIRFVTATGNGGSAFASGAGLQELLVSNGEALATYEVVAAKSTTVESIEVPVTVGYTADPNSNNPAPGTSSLSISFGPAPPDFTFAAAASASSTLPLPRFVADFFAARNAFTVGVCRGTPFITDLTPRSANSNSGPLNLTVTGTGFTSGSFVRWQGKAEPTTVVSATQLNAVIPAADLAAVTSSTAQVAVGILGGFDSAAANFQVIQVIKPVIKSGGVVDAAEDLPVVSPGGIASLFGTNLAAAAGTFPAPPLPLSNAGTSVTVNGVAAPLFYSSATQINFQVPYEAPVSASANVVVTRDGVPSDPASVSVALFAPQVFVVGSEPAITHQDGSLVSPGSPAVANEVLTIYATGIGGVSNRPATGAAAQVSPLSMATSTPTVALGPLPVQVLFVGLTPGFAGLAQINVRLPQTLPTGARAPLTISFNNASSSPVNMAIQGNK